MCGILGLYNFDETEIIKMLNNLSYRGRDGYGVYIKNTNNSEIIKSMKNINTLTINDVPFISTAKLIIANSRAVPTTEYSIGAGFDIINQQPFSNDRYVVVHNGLLKNDKELIKKYNLKPTSKVDSAILPHLFSKLGVVKGLRQLEGSYAIICYDKKDRMIYAGKNFMPLRIITEGRKIGFISLSNMTTYKSEEIKPYTCLRADKHGIKEYSLCVDKKRNVKKRNKKVLVICSGGIDSTTTAYLYKYLGYEVGLIHFKYGQAAEKAEEFAVKQIANNIKAKLYIYDAKPIFKPFKDISKLLSQKKANPNDQMEDAESTYSYVPNRNAIMAMVAAGVAEKEGYDTLSFGGQQMDSVYPDNNPTFVDAINNLLPYSLNWNSNIKFTAPLIHLIKHEIVELGIKIGVNYDLICSCYYPKIKNNKIVHCEKCGCCSFRLDAFKIVKEKTFINNVNKYIKKYIIKHI